MGIPGEYTLTNGYDITKEMCEDFKTLGYVIIRSLLDKEEVGMIMKCLTGSDGLAKEAFTLERGERKTYRATWNHPGSDVTGLVARSEKVVNTCEKMLGDGVYHYHSKLMFKDAKIAAPHYWHQDYGYWYHNGCLFPDMMTVFIALDPCTKQNGCLEILPGSHKCGRIEHQPIDGQYGADMSRVNEIRQKCPLMYVELNPGDAIFFHSNLLHHSSANRSDMRRWAYLISYNTRSNDPVIEHHHASYTPLDKVPNTAIKECTNFTDMTGKGFINPPRGNSRLIEEYTTTGSAQR